MAYSRKRKASTFLARAAKRRFNRRLRKTQYARRRRTGFAKKVMRVVNARAETKVEFNEIAHNVTLLHNELKNLEDNAFYTSLGAAGEQIGSSGNGTRIGQKCYIKGIKCSLMIEAQQYRPHTTYWLYLVRNKLTPNGVLDVKSEMFEGVSTTIPMDYIDTSKVDIMFCKKFTLRMPNAGTSNTMETTTGNPGHPDGTADGTTFVRMTNPQLIKKFYVPIKRNCYYRDDGDGQAVYPQSNMRYQWVMVAYDNFTTVTSGSTYPVGHVSLSTKLLFTDI